ncbi:hypothetical protein ACWGS9_29475 [Bradyrhizobium sp. Arg314]
MTDHELRTRLKVLSQRVSELQAARKAALPQGHIERGPSDLPPPPSHPVEKAPEVTHTRRWTGFVIAALALGTWLAVPFLPSAETCAFRDNSILRWLWPGNHILYVEMSQWAGSTRDQCVLLATQSMLSVYCAAIALLVYFGSPISRSAATLKQPKPGLMSLLFGGMMIGSFFIGGFDDHATGRGAWMAFTTTDTPNIILLKSLARMYLVYILGLGWVVHMKAALYQGLLD